ncbi:MAG: hypothetical protein M3N13_04110 [Candidatus Eremiobacteraeota bacterium]|nr:hypothetical protein [Candidatus Eremiobacteraeota bacterium]
MKFETGDIVKDYSTPRPGIVMEFFDGDEIEMVSVSYASDATIVSPSPAGNLDLIFPDDAARTNIKQILDSITSALTGVSTTERLQAYLTVAREQRDMRVVEILETAVKASEVGRFGG